MLFQHIWEDKYLCTFRLGLCERNDYVRRDLNQDVFDIIDSKPASARSNDFINKLYAEHRENFNAVNRETVKVVLMSDLHVDYEYQEGQDNKCDHVLCCRVDSGPAPTKARRAGKWGDFNCDLNERTMNSMFDFIKDEIRPEVVLWGGDSIPHDVDSLTFESNVETMKRVSRNVQNGLRGLRVFPTIGNHDTYPQDVIKMSIPRSNEAIN